MNWSVIVVNMGFVILVLVVFVMKVGVANVVPTLHKNVNLLVMPLVLFVGLMDVGGVAECAKDTNIVPMVLVFVPLVVKENFVDLILVVHTAVSVLARERSVRRLIVFVAQIVATEIVGLMVVMVFVAFVGLARSASIIPVNMSIAQGHQFNFK